MRSGDGVTPRVVRVAGARTGRIGVVVTPDGERSFVTDRAAALQLGRPTCRPAWFARADAVHLPVYSLLDEPLSRGRPSRVELGRAAGAAISLDLASIGPLLARGRRAARALVADIAPDILFATASEAEALLGKYAVDGLLDVAAVAVVKRGAEGRHGPRPRRRCAAALRGRHRADRGDRHDRRRRRVRRRVPGRLVRVARGRSIAAGLAPARRPGRPPRGGAPAVDGPGRATARLADAREPGPRHRSIQAGAAAAGRSSVAEAPKHSSDRSR